MLQSIIVPPTAMSALLLAKGLLALQTEAFRFVVLFVLPIACYARLQSETFKRLEGLWKLCAMAPALLLGAVVYVLASDAIIALVLHHEPAERLFIVYLFTGAACSGFLCALLAGRRLMLAGSWRWAHRPHRRNPRLRD